MPSNDERREVARRLRDNADQKPGWVIPWAAFNDAYEHKGAELLNRLADLIEPEERTCRNVGGDEWGFKCSECGGHTHGEPFHVPDEERKTLAEMLGGRIVSLHGSVPRFCPNCGAKVIHDA